MAEPVIDRIPLARSVIYAVRGMPEVAEEFNPERTIVPTEITLHYRSVPDGQLGRVSAYVKGWWMQDGKRIPMDKPVGRWFYGGPDGWPEWLAEEVRLHDPDARIADLRKEHWAGLRRADEINNQLMEEVQRYADGKERPVLWSVYNAMHKRALTAEAEVERLSRTDDEAQTGVDTAQQPAVETQLTPPHPPRHRWYVETLDNLANEWAPGTRFLNRAHAADRYTAQNERYPMWKDGSRVRRRLVRETTTYTVEESQS